MPDFRRLRVGAHRPDPRATSSIVVACMALGLATMLAASLTLPTRRDPPKSTGEVAPPPAADKVTIVSAAPKLDVPCAEQTWPYIDRRCLKETTQKRPQTDPPAREAFAPAAPIDARNATPPVIPAPTPQAAQENEPARDMIATAPPQETTSHHTGEADEEIANLDEPDEDVALPPVPPREVRRGERRRAADPGQRIVREWRDFGRRLLSLPRGF